MTTEDALELDLIGIESTLPCTFWWQGISMTGLKDSGENTLGMRDVGWVPSYSTKLSARASLFGTAPAPEDNLVILTPDQILCRVAQVDTSLDGLLLTFSLTDLNAIKQIEYTADGLEIVTADGQTISIQ